MYDESSLHLSQGIFLELGEIINGLILECILVVSVELIIHDCIIETFSLSLYDSSTWHTDDLYTLEFINNTENSISNITNLTSITYLENHWNHLFSNHLIEGCHIVSNSSPGNRRDH